MRHAIRFLSGPWLPALVFLTAPLATGCRGEVGGTPGNGGSGMTGLGGITGTGGAGGVAEPCTGASDPRLVPAPQRVVRLTNNEILNTVRYLVDSTEATALLTKGLIAGDAVAVNRLFPPLQSETIIGDEYRILDQIGQDIQAYVLANFGTLTGCTSVTDACATTYLNTFAQKAYRRRLTTDEQTRLTALYGRLKSQPVNGYTVTTTVQEATSYGVYAILSSPQMLWRWELGNPAMASTTPAGIPLTDSELATHLSFFLTDQPPDQALLDAAASNSLRSSLGTHVDRLLATQTSKDWLRTIIETYYLLNQLPNTPIDRAVFPVYTPQMANDMRTEAQKFLDNVLWNGNLTDLMLSRTTFVNETLARDIYAMAVPAGANATTFVQATLPTDRRAGLMTNPAFVTSRGRTDGKALVVPRGRAIVAAVLCMPPDSPPDAINQPGGPVDQARDKFDEQTAQEQVAFRASIALCGSCHAQFDPYGLALEWYDTIGRYRTADDRGLTPDARTPVPEALGGGMVDGAIAMAEKLAASPLFTACMARTMLQYAMVDFSAPVELPNMPKTAGCAAADVVAKYDAGSAKTFSALVRATTASPAFVLRKAAP
jgi:hypothetical protein